MRAVPLLAVAALHGALLLALWPGPGKTAPGVRRELAVRLLPAATVPTLPARRAAPPRLALPALAPIAPPAFEVQLAQARPAPAAAVAEPALPSLPAALATPAAPRGDAHAAEPAALQSARRAACAPAPHPLALRERGIEGVVRLRVWVDELGRADLVLQHVDLPQHAHLQPLVAARVGQRGPQRAGDLALRGAGAPPAHQRVAALGLGGGAHVQGEALLQVLLQRLGHGVAARGGGDEAAVQRVVVLVALQHQQLLRQHAHALQRHADADDGAVRMAAQLPQAAAARAGDGGMGGMRGAAALGHARSPVEARAGDGWLARWEMKDYLVRMSLPWAVTRRR